MFTLVGLLMPLLLLLLRSVRYSQAQNDSITTVLINSSQLILSQNWTQTQTVSTCGGVAGLGYSDKGSFVTLLFTGVGFTVNAFGDIQGTTVAIYLDEQYYSELDTSSASSFASCVPAVSTSGPLVNGEHNVTVVIDEEGAALYMHGFTYTVDPSSSSSPFSSSSSSPSSSYSSSSSSSSSENPSSTSSPTSNRQLDEGDQIALGTGISIPMAGLIVAVFAWLGVRPTREFPYLQWT